MLELLNAHRDWANEIMIRWFTEQPAAQSDEYCHKILSHVLLAEEVWIGRILEKPVRGPWACLLAPSEMEAMRLSHDAAWNEILRGAAGPLNRVFSYRRFTGAEAASSIENSFTHVCTHGAYHRGQVAAQAARIGLKPPSTDFILFADLG